MQNKKNQKIFRMQPIMCPWITSQPYHSSLWNKNRSLNPHDPSLTNRFLNNPWVNRHMPLGISRFQDKQIPSIQESSSQFFYFLRLMQLFPDTHPATLHTVLTLCKNDFFRAVDKMLYAKRCKLLCYKKNLMQRNQQNRNKGVCNNSENGTQEKNSKNDSTRINKQTLSNTTVQKKEDPFLGIVLQQDTTAQSLMINSFSEKAEDLSVTTNSDKSRDENSPQTQTPTQ